MAEQGILGEDIWYCARVVRDWLVFVDISVNVCHVNCCEVHVVLLAMEERVVEVNFRLLCTDHRCGLSAAFLMSDGSRASNKAHIAILGDDSVRPNNPARHHDTCRSLLSLTTETTMSSVRGGTSRGRGRGSTQQPAARGRGASNTRGAGFNTQSTRGNAATRSTFAQGFRGNATRGARGSNAPRANASNSLSTFAAGALNRVKSTGSPNERFQAVSTPSSCVY